MKRLISCIVILALSVGIGFSWSFMEDYITRTIYPVKYYEIVEKYSEEYSVPRDVIYAVIKCESSFTADAVSHAGAVGLMQVMPSTYEWLCTKTGDEVNLSTLYDPEVNIKYGTYLLGYLYSRYGVWETVYAAYNAGFGRVDSWLEDSRYSLDGRLTEIPIEETKNYVKKVSEAKKIYSELLREMDTEISGTSVTVVE